jgi:hypothetical protein
MICEKKKIMNLPEFMKCRIRDVYSELFNKKLPQETLHKLLEVSLELFNMIHWLKIPLTKDFYTKLLAEGTKRS